MATHANSTTVPVVQTGLLPFVLRPVPPVDDPRNAVELLDEIRRTIEGQDVSVQSAPEPELLPEPLLLAFHGDTRTDIGSTDRCSSATNYPDHIGVVDDRPDEIRLADAARTLHLRRQLAEAAEHGVALLDALGLPRLVTADFVALDPAAIGDALDVVIATLDAVDGDADLEEGGDDEPSLGWIDGRPQFCGDNGDLELDNADDEPSLASPERHPTSPYPGSYGRYVARGPQDNQKRWADGGKNDHEADITDELHDGDGEDLEAEPDEPILGATEEVDQTAWAESGTCDREFDATDCIDRHKPRGDYEASVARRGDMVALTRRVEALRRGVQTPTPHVYRDNVRPIVGAKCWEVPAHV